MAMVSMMLFPRRSPARAGDSRQRPGPAAAPYRRRPRRGQGPARALLLAPLLPAAPAAAQPADAIERFRGGGVAGGGSGLRLLPDGSAFALRRARAPLEAVPIPRQGPSYAEILALLEAAGFERLASAPPGNLTCSLTLRREGRRHSVTWPAGAPPAALAPALAALGADRP
jgi:hypothetical protein